MAALKRAGLAYRAKGPLTILPGGQARQTLIARALVRDPELLIMGEPMTGISQASRERLAQTISESKNIATTIPIVLHELGEPGSPLDREPHIGPEHINCDGVPYILDDHEQHADEDGHHHAYLAAPTSPALVDDVLKGAQRALS